MHVNVLRTMWYSDSFPKMYGFLSRTLLFWKADALYCTQEPCYLCIASMTEYHGKIFKQL